MIPYAMEIEYLKGDGNAHIVLPFNGYSNKTTFEFEFIFAGSVNCSLIGSRANSNERFCWCAIPSTGNLLQIGYGSSYDNLSIRTNVEDVINVKTEIAGNSINYIVTNKTAGTSSNKSWDTATFHVLDYIYLFWNGTLSKSRIKIKKCVIKNEGVTIVDCCPVRVGNVGYLFDRVSGQLFGNSGTGSFVLGPDVAPAAYANEIAFLESTREQYIDTGIIPTDNIKVALNANYTYTDISYLFGCISTDYRTNCFSLSGNKDLVNPEYFRCFVSGNSMSVTTGNVMVKDTPELHSCVLDKNHLEIDGVEYPFTYAASLPLNISHSIYLYARNNIGTADYLTSMKVYGFKIWQNDTLVRDFIPVEYNNIGYMYDKVSGEFFANQGTGKFVLGHRAPRFDGKACARSYTRRQLMMDVVAVKPYISNGLVMHFDGADFNGTTTWNSRVGGFVATKQGSGSIVKTSDGGVEFVGGTDAQNARCFLFNKEVPVSNTVGTIEICAYRKAKTLRYPETILDCGTVNRITYKINSNRTAAVIANYTSNSPSAPITYGVGKFTHSINNDRQVWNGQSKALGANGSEGRSHNTIAGRENHGAWNFVGVIYQIRVYNRKLSEAEMKWNQDQDRKRYGIQF